jgi:hypothetical protein
LAGFANSLSKEKEGMTWENRNMLCPNRARNLKKTVTLIVIVLLFGSAVLSAGKLDQFVEVASGTTRAF